MNIIIYSTPSCPHCIAIKELLKQKKIPFTDKNVMDDENALKEMLEKTDNYSSVPVVDIDGKILLSPDEDEIRKELNI